jgi:hypothetical protein
MVGDPTTLSLLTCSLAKLLHSQQLVKLQQTIQKESVAQVSKVRQQLIRSYSHKKDCFYTLRSRNPDGTV